MKEKIIKFLGYFCLLFFCLPEIVCGNSNLYNVYFSLIYPNTFNDYDDEYFEITNIGFFNLDLSGFFIKDKSGKTYTFPSVSSLAGSEILKLPYVTTKIQLNNTNEELYFYDSGGVLIDSYSYATSTKGQVINRDLSGFVQFSSLENSGSLNSGTGETNSGATEENSNSGGINSGNAIKSFFTSTGSFEIAYTGAILKNIYFSGAGILEANFGTGTGNFSFSGEVLDGNINFLNLFESTTYFYQVNLVNSGIVDDSFGGSFKTNLIEVEPVKLFYDDKDKNGKVDNFEIEFSKSVTGSLDLSKIRIYSNSGGISSRLINDEIGLISTYYFSGNILGLNLFEQDLEKTNLKITNTTSSDLRLKTLTGYGVLDLSGNSAKNLTLTSSFDNYKNVFSRISSSGSLVNSGSISDTGSLSNSGNLENSGSSIIQTGQTNSGSENLAIPDIYFDFQIPSYVDNKDLNLTIFNCDNSKEECKINFNLESSFSGIYREGDYYCNINFGFISSESNECNPGTVIFPIGIYNVVFQIHEKGNSANFKEKTIKIINTGFRVFSGYSGQNFSSISNNLTIIPEPKITIQSGLDENFNCKKSDCTVNFNGQFSPYNSKISCKWDFGNISISEDQKNKCNPSYLHYGFGEHEVKLTLFEIGNESNFKQTSLKFYNNFTSKVDTEKEILLENSGSTLAKITLQGKIGNSKKLEGNTLYCYSNSCSVNFTGQESVFEKNKKPDFFWDFGNGITGTGSNPKAIIFEKGEYKVVLKIIIENKEEFYDYFYIKVLGKAEVKEEKNKEKEKEKPKNFDKNAIKKVLKKHFSQEINWKDNNLEIIGKTLPDVLVKIELVGTGLISFQSVLVVSLENDFKNSGYITKSNNEGNYKLSIPFLADGKYNIKTSINYDGKDFFELGTTKQFSFNDKFREKMSKKEIDGKKEFKAQIVLQGKLTKNSSFHDKTLVCFARKNCNINLKAYNNKDKNLTYIWDFGNKMRFEGLNPKSTKFNFGNYKATLVVTNTKTGEIKTDYIFIKSKKIATKKKIIKKKAKKEKITKVKAKKIILSNHSTKTKIDFGGNSNYLYFTALLSFLGITFLYLIAKRNRKLI
ncbi:MAG: lamin tail domain-containing protein [Candidatus Gracilibacteria bacterium]|nr:lamin tail domain-containing protein [Candidatus Gracilibacteria bacterium]